MKQLVPRRFDRKRFIAEAVVRPLGGGPPQKVHVYDLAEGGLAVFAHQSLTEGLHVEIVFRANLAAVRAGLGKREGRVAYNRVLPDGNAVGVVFTKPLDVAELKLLMAAWVRS
jgi:hypothetical protein